MQVKIKIWFYILLLFMFSCNFRHETITNDKIKVAVFNGNGASTTCVLETLEALKIDQKIQGEEITAADIVLGKLQKYDVLIFSGGSGSKELNNLGDYNEEIINNFVKEKGKGVVGICAGGYLLSSTPTYPCLHLLSAKNIDREHYDRGRGLIEFELTDKGNEIFPELSGKNGFLQYYNGPVLQPVDKNHLNYIELAEYVTDIHQKESYPSGITPGKTFMLHQTVVKGRIFIVAGHPESTPGMRWMVPRMVRWASNKEMVKYNEKWVSPGINNKEILFETGLIAYEKENYWLLFNDSPDSVIMAMDNLYNIRSRPAVRWYLGLLRNKNAKVRRKAAELLMKTEYTRSVSDLYAALQIETDSLAKTSIEASINFLTEF